MMKKLVIENLEISGNVVFNASKIIEITFRIVLLNIK